MEIDKEIILNNDKGVEIGKVILETKYEPRTMELYIYSTIKIKYPLLISRQMMSRIDSEGLKKIIMFEIEDDLRNILRGLK